jgi:aconitate hydratase
MGVLPLQFLAAQSKESLGLTGEETFSVLGIASGLAPGKELDIEATAAEGSVKKLEPRARIDTAVELAYYQHGGILQFVLRQLLKS